MEDATEILIIKNKRNASFEKKIKNKKNKRTKIKCYHFLRPTSNVLLPIIGKEFSLIQFEKIPELNSWSLQVRTDFYLNRIK